METHTIRLINGTPILLTPAQELELKRDGLAIVGDRIIRTGSYINRMHAKAGETIAATAKRVFRDNSHAG